MAPEVQVGDRIKSKLGDYGLDVVMKSAYHNLSLDQCKNKCSNIYDDISETFFKWAKDLWDYEYNFSTLEGRQDCSGYTSNPEYTEQVVAAQNAYSQLCKRCDDEDSSDSYCMKFKRERISKGKCTAGGPTELNCKITLGPVDQPSEEIDKNANRVRSLRELRKNLEKLKNQMPCICRKLYVQ
ncbi:KIR-like CYIR protein [Plasmodium cynomolgi strain B]|uniref:KIR-like CYIR protein n=1 Tax=Plasmodium cynomolgi (strain B) TaxID=1120755 RepID=K6UE58_PLACD|nr:KIR-like CYIR protein [Plasmodium cynomolgi strain B]GAB67776.1 KIR-like CYIR protein [Plasmodium cynomolgi strain B]